MIFLSFPFFFKFYRVLYIILLLLLLYYYTYITSYHFSNQTIPLYPIFDFYYLHQSENLFQEIIGIIYKRLRSKKILFIQVSFIFKIKSTS